MPVIPAPRFESSRCSPDGASGEGKANSCATSKWQIQLSQCRLPFLGGTALAPLGGMIMPPNGVQGQRPWHAFGDFRRETKVTRVPSMARPCSRGAPPRGECRGAAPLAYRATQGPPSLQKSPRGGPQSPSTYTPKRTKSCIPTCNPGKEKNKKRKPPCFSAGPVLYSI